MEPWPRDATPAPVDLLRRESRSLVQRLRLWTPARYAAAAPPWGTRADLVRHLAQSCADAAAQLEGGPRRALPRLDSDLGLSVLVSVGLIVFGALTFVMDFDQADRMVAAGVPEKESWRVAFGLVVGLVFLYLEILRLLSYFQGRD